MVRKGISKVKNRIVTLSIREIKKNIKRFLSLVILSFLGVTVFVGIKLASEDMFASLDTYYNDSNVYDIKLISTLGLTESDVEAIKNIDNRLTVYGVHSKDFTFKSGNVSDVIKVIELDDIHNKVILNEGRLPQNKNEVVVEKAMIRKTDIKTGDTIELDVSDDDETVNSKKFTIVGTVQSPFYLLNGNGSASRGSTTIGNGKVNFYSYAVPEFFNIDYFTEIYVNIENDFQTDSVNYKSLVDEVTDKIESIKVERQNARYNEIVIDANKEIDDKEKEALKEFDSAKNELDSANELLSSGLDSLNVAENQLYTLKKQLDSSYVEIINGKNKIKNGENELASAKYELDSALEEINSKLKEYNLTYDEFLVIKKVIEGKSLNRQELVLLIPNDIKSYDTLVKVVNHIYDNGYDNILNELISGIKNTIIRSIPEEVDNYDEIVNYIENINVEKVKKSVLDFLFDSENVEKIKQIIPKDILGYDFAINVIQDYQSLIEKITKVFARSKSN